jgi:hypothetical protein
LGEFECSESNLKVTGIPPTISILREIKEIRKEVASLMTGRSESSASIIHDVLRNRTLITRVFRITPAYSAHLSHSLRDNGTYIFLFRIVTVAHSKYFPGDSREVSIGIENSISDPLFWQLTSGNKLGRLPEKRSKELEVLMRLSRHFLRLLSWVNSILKKSHPSISDDSILFIQKIRFIMQHPK